MQSIRNVAIIYTGHETVPYERLQHMVAAFEKRGAKGKKIFDRICKVTAIILILFLIIILLKTFLF